MALPRPPQVLSLNPRSLQEVLESVVLVGNQVGLPEAAAQAREQLESRLRASTRSPPQRPNVLFIEWPDPVFVGGHWTPQILHNAGGTQRINPEVGRKSFTVSDEDISRDDPDLIVVAPCGLNLEATAKVLRDVERHPVRGPWWRSLRAVQQGRVYMADGSLMFNRPSHHLVAAQEWMAWVLSDPGTPASVRPAGSCPLPDFPWAPYVSE